MSSDIRTNDINEPGKQQKTTQTIVIIRQIRDIKLFPSYNR